MAIIDKPSDYFNTVIYTGNGGTQGITGVGFKPDFNWIKDRDGTPSHVWHDIIRGVTKRLMSNNTNAEDTGSQINSFDTDGFTVPNNNNNTNGSDYVAWNWLGSNTTASNGNGSITSTVSVNTTSGFSVVKYPGNGSAGATIGHGLGTTPQIIFIKTIDSASYPWYAYSEAIGNTKHLRLNDTNAEDTALTIFNNTSPTSSVFSVGTNGGANGSGLNLIAYCFAPKQGFSKMGSYTGNGNADGPFIYTGFKPAMIIRKNVNAADEWTLIDSTRSPFNPTNATLVPNSTAADSTDWDTDIFSNGFKPRTVESAHNGNGNKIIYMAFAKNPFVTSTANGSIPATAR